MKTHRIFAAKGSLLRSSVLVITAVALAAVTAATLARDRQMTLAGRMVDEMLSGQRAPDAELLRQLGPQALAPLLKALRIDHPALEQAYAVLPSVLPDSVSQRLPVFLRAQGRRLNASAWVGYLGPAAKPAVPQLIRLLKDDFADGNAAKSLGMIGSAAQESVPALIVALGEHRPFAAIALGSIGTPETVGPALDAAARQGPTWQREEARLALRKLWARFPG